MSVQKTRQDGIVPLGHISGVHGVKGWVKVHSWTRPREAILEYQPWLVGKDRTPLSIVSGRRQGKAIIASLPGVDDRDQALAFVRQEIAVFRSQMPELQGAAYYWADLEGLEVTTVEGRSLGRVTRLMETGAHDVMVVDGDRQRLIPFVQGQYVRQVDLGSGCIEVDWDPEF